MGRGRAEEAIGQIVSQFYRVIKRASEISALFGGVVLTFLALLMSVSVLGGAISKLANADWLAAAWPEIAELLQASGIRTIKAMFEAMAVGIAFVIFAFLPITQLERGHAVVDVFTDFLPPRINRALIAFWEVLFCATLIFITFRLHAGMARLQGAGTIFQDLQIPLWWGYGVGVVQMALASLVAIYTAMAACGHFLTGREFLPQADGAKFDEVAH